MTELENLFNRTKTQNGDDAFLSSGDILIDILFKTSELRQNPMSVQKHHLSKVDPEKALLFARFIRDPRLGMGERNLGRQLLGLTGANPEEIVATGRFDDLYNIANKENLDFFVRELKAGNYLAKKWAPRLTSGDKSKENAKLLCQYIGITQKEYRELIKLDETIEYKITHKNYDDIDFSSVSSLAHFAHKTPLSKGELGVLYDEYLDSVEKGETSIKVATSTPYDIYRAFVQQDGGCTDKIIDPKAQIFWDALNHISLGSILPIIDNSGSMYDIYDSASKAQAIGHYVSKNSTYEPGKIVSFSSEPRLIDLGTTYDDAINAMNSFHDISTTNLGKVFNILADLREEEDTPEYLLVLSDMQFDMGSSKSKETCMREFKKRGIKTKIIWWNFRTEVSTFPEIDEYGNIFMSGYNPKLLGLLENKFDANAYLDKLLSEYDKNTKKGESCQA